MNAAWSRCLGRAARMGWLALLLAGPLMRAAEIPLDDFEDPARFARWTFSWGAEFPGATGSLARAEGRIGAGARLAYDFSGGGAYVAANFTLPVPLNCAAVAFWVRSPAGIRIVLRLGDSTGQTLQYNLSRPFWNLDPAAWYRQVVPVDGPNSWWGGANDGQAHLPIRSLSVLAADPLEPGLVGAISLDDVVALDALALELDPALQPVIAAPPGGGNLQQRLGVNIHFTSDDRALDAARSAGMDWVRMDLTWSSVEPQTNQFNWSAYDSLVQALEARGMKALFILDYGHPVHTGGMPPTNAAQVLAFSNYAQAAAQHFAGHGALFEVWNEPNISGFWKPEPNTNHYAALTRAVIPAVQRADPAAGVLVGALAGPDHRFARGFLSLGGGEGAAGVSVHPYLGDAASLSDHVLNLRAIVQQTVPANPPLYDSEWGYTSAAYGDGHSTNARLVQAQRVPRRLLASWAAGMPLMIYYDIRDDGLESTNTEHNFGLLARDYTDKPAMQAVRTLSAVSAGRLFTGFYPLEASRLTAMRLDGPTNTVVALWPGTRAGDLPVRVPAGASALDYLGAPISLQPDAQGLWLTVRQTNSPVYVSLPGPGRVTNFTLVPTGAAWRYLDTGTNLGSNWVAAEFDDRTWRSGRAPLGYGETGLGTTVSYGPDPNNKYVTTYFRHRFVLREAAAIGALRLRLRRDDGAVVYLNGRLAFASHLPGWPAYNTFANATVSGEAETNFLATWLPVDLLVEGTNTVAVEIHQVNATSSDISFDLELQATAVRLPPTQAALPPLQVVAAGSNLTLAARHDGVSPFGYQWWWNGTNLLARQTQALLLVTNAQPAHSGLYQFVVSNRFGSATSSTAQVIVTPSLATNFTLISTGAVWRYLDTGVDPGPNWAQPEFNDAGWLSGRAILGYNNGNEATTIRFGPDPNNKYITYWFRRAFVLEAIESIHALSLRLLRDDGAAVYLNGQEVFRNNLPAGPLTPTTLASATVGGPDETNYISGALPLGPLRAGTNVVAVEVHQAATNSSDLSFDLELRAAAVLLAPWILEPPADQLVLAGSNVTFAVRAEGSPPLRYQWLCNGTNLPGATNAVLVLTNLAPSQSGAYAVRVSNAAGATQSRAATLQVILPPGLRAAWDPAGEVKLHFDVPAGLGCVVLASTNLTEWVVLTNFPSPGGPAQFTDPEAGLYRQRFYRLRLNW